MTINEVIKNMDVEEFLKQKEWLTEQVAELTPSAAERFPEGILTFLEQIQDAAEEELQMDFTEFPETEEVTEYCSECDREVTMNWNVKKDGLKAFCPHCGKRLMLCSCCPATDNDQPVGCDYNQKTDSCRFNKAEKAKVEEPVKNEPQNTLITYLYRDACNYKVHNEAVVKGLMTQEQEQRILNSLLDGEYFIPHLVGLPEERFATVTEDDHPYFEYQSLSPTNAPASCDMDVEELVKAFEKYAKNWEIAAAIGENDALENHAIAVIRKAIQDMKNLCV